MVASLSAADTLCKLMQAISVPYLSVDHGLNHCCPKLIQPCMHTRKGLCIQEHLQGERRPTVLHP